MAHRQRLLILWELRKRWEMHVWELAEELRILPKTVSGIPSGVRVGSVDIAGKAVTVDDAAVRIRKLPIEQEVPSRGV